MHLSSFLLAPSIEIDDITTLEWKFKECWEKGNYTAIQDLCVLANSPGEKVKMIEIAQKTWMPKKTKKPENQTKQMSTSQQSLFKSPNIPEMAMKCTNNNLSKTCTWTPRLCFCMEL